MKLPQDQEMLEKEVKKEDLKETSENVDVSKNSKPKRVRIKAKKVYSVKI